MDVALEYLLKDEWTMGNGQCHVCCGLGESFVYGVNQGTEWGHEKGCSLAKAIKSLGGNPFYKRTFYMRPYTNPKSEIFWTKVNDDYRKAFMKSFRKSLEKVKWT